MLQRMPADTQHTPDVRFQQARLQMLRALRAADFLAAVHAQLSSAHLPLHFGRPGDLFGEGAPNAPVESAAWLRAAPSSSDRKAICSGVFRSADC